MNLLCDFEFINLLNQILLPKKQNFLRSNDRKNHVTTSHVRKKHSAIFYLINRKLVILQKMYEMSNASLRPNISTTHVALLTMYIVTRQMKIQQKASQIILYTKEGEHWKRYLVEFFKLIFKRNINFIDVHYEDLIRLNTEYSDLSCIITDTPIKVNYVPVIFISTIPTKRNLEEIKKFL